MRGERLGLAARVILLLHHRYRHAGGEERAVEDLAWLIREHLGEDVEVLERDSAALEPRGRGARAARAAGCAPSEVGDGRAAHRRAGRARAQHRTRRSAGARWPRRARRARGSCCTCTTTGSSARSARASRTARTARAATAATRCPGVRLNCRGGSRAEAAAYAAGLALWQRRLAERGRRDRRAERVRAATACASSARRSADARVLGSVQREFADALARRRRRVRARRRPADAREGVRRRGRGLPRAPGCRSWSPATARSAPRWSARAAGDARFVGHVAPGRARRAARAAPRSRSSPRATPRSCRSPRWRRWPPGCPSSPRAPAGSSEAVPEEGLYPPGDVDALARPAHARSGATRRPASARWPRARERCAPDVIAATLREIYGATSRREPVLKRT